MLKLAALTTPAAAAAATSWRDSSGVIASGFSQTTWRPAPRISSVCGKCRSFGEVTWTTSTPRSRRRSWSELYARATPRVAARAAPRSGLLPRTPRTCTPTRRRASTWTVPMNPVPMTAAPMSAILLMGSILLCHVKCKSRRFLRRSAYHRGMTTGIGRERPNRSGPLPDESLDALVTILDEIRFGRSRSRSELVARTGLGRAIVAQRVGELLERGLVTEGDVGPSTGGRPPRQLTFHAEGGHLLVADLGATSIDVAVTTLDGRILGHHDEPARIEDGPDACLGRVDVLFEALLTTTQEIPGRLWGIGIGVPGPVEFDTGRPISPPIMPGWDGYPIRERFSARFDAPVWVDNDVNLLALGESRSGVAAGHDDVVVIKIGTGVGAGIVSDGRLHRGAQGSAGDVGHIQVSEDPGVVCRCGNIGCLEALAGGDAIGRAGEAAARAGRSERMRLALD